MIVSKDSGFSESSALLGSPPKVIWLRVGNCTTALADPVLRTDLVLRTAATRLANFREWRRGLPGTQVSQSDMRSGEVIACGLIALQFEKRQ